MANNFTKLDKKTKLRYLKEMNLDEGSIKEFLKSKKHGKIDEAISKGYTLYEKNKFGEISNFFAEELSTSLTRKYSHFFKTLFLNIRKSGINILSRTYVSILLFCSFLGFLTAALASFFIFMDDNIILSLAKAFFVGIMAGMLVFGAVYMYPSIVVGTKQRRIKNELPFVILHMTSVAGSGAHPLSMFKLIIDAEEYPELEGEVRKIVNYVNLFGYDLTSALRTVAVTTPSDDFRELLNGMIATIETGGDLKSYLTEKARDSMNKYKLERKKYVQKLATYSDVYTALLIAAPLLFVVTLAVMNAIGGGDIGGFTIGQIATFGTYGIIPLLNVLFIVFITIMQPD